MSNHIEICKELNEIYNKKNNDYGDSFSKVYDEYGRLSVAIRLTDKLERFKSLLDNKQQVEDESIRDTLLDLANYAIMAITKEDNN